jgi:hypothetical protein
MYAVSGDRDQFSEMSLRSNVSSEFGGMPGRGFFP